jgi:hypothetical protein
MQEVKIIKVIVFLWIKKNMGRINLLIVEMLIEINKFWVKMDVGLLF